MVQSNGQLLHPLYRGFGLMESVTKGTLLDVSPQALATFCLSHSLAGAMTQIVPSDSRCLKICSARTEDLRPGL